MEMLISNFLVIVTLNLGTAEYVEVSANTFTSILNRNYTEDIVSVSSKMECVMFCLNTNFCEAIYYEKTANDSRCLLRKYTTNILYPLIIGTSLPGNSSVMFLRKNKDYCVVPHGYQFEPNLMFWYRVVVTPKLNAANARKACRQDNAYLLLIDDDNQYFFARDLLVQNSLGTVYTQGTRTTNKDPYLNENGNIMTYHDNWDIDGIQGPGNYIRVGSDGIETSTGTGAYAYVCQLRLN